MKKHIVLVSALILCYQAIVPAEPKSLTKSVSFGRKCKIVMTAALFFTTAAIAGTNEESICLDPALQVHSALQAGHAKTKAPITKSECLNIYDKLCIDDCYDQLRITSYRKLKKEIDERLNRIFNGQEVRKNSKYYTKLDEFFDTMTQDIFQCKHACNKGHLNCIRTSEKEKMRLEYIRQIKLFWEGTLEDLLALTYEQARKAHAIVFPDKCEHSDCY